MARAPVRTLIVESAAGVRGRLERVLGREPGIAIAGRCGPHDDVVGLASAVAAELVLLTEGPATAETLRALRRAQPDRAAVVVSDAAGAANAMRALSLGAMDVVYDPGPGGEEVLAKELRAVARAARARVCGSAPSRPAPGPVVAAPRRSPPREIALVVIASSTGGPHALEKLLPALPADLPCPIAIAQHLPPGFSDPLARSLDRRTPLLVREAGDGEPLAVGHVLVAPAGHHLEVRPATRPGAPATLHVVALEAGDAFQPSADRLLRSAAVSLAGAVLAVVLTGMGADGREGVRAVRERGGWCLAQDERSCVVYGMPRAVVEAGLADEVLPIGEIAGRIEALARGEAA